MKRLSVVLATALAAVVTTVGAAQAITVGAVDTKGTADRRDDVVAPYSSRGPTRSFPAISMRRERC